MEFLSTLNMNLNELQLPVIHIQADAGNGVKGQLRYNTDSNTLQYSTGSVWKSLYELVLGSETIATSTIPAAGTFAAVTGLSLSNGTLTPTKTTFTLPSNLVGIAGVDSEGLLQRDSQGNWSVISSASVGAGTVTNVATGTGLTGGPITSTGTISLASSTAVTDNNSYYVQLRKTNNDELFYKSGFTFNPSTTVLSGVKLATGTEVATTPGASDNSTKVATTAYVTDALSTLANTIAADIEALPEPMVFKGSVGTGGTYTSSTLPAAAAGNEGWTVKVITDGTYQGVTAKVGDTLISDGSSWVLIPSGDEPSGTVTSVGISTTNSATGLTLSTVSGSPVTSSGTINLGLTLDTGYVIPTTSQINRYKRGQFTTSANTFMYKVAHELSSANLICQVYDSDNNLVGIDISVDSTYVTVTFGVLPTVGETYYVHMYAV